jgi:lipopolysaccharide transport system permease protein
MAAHRIHCAFMRSPTYDSCPRRQDPVRIFCSLTEEELCARPALERSMAELVFSDKPRSIFAYLNPAAMFRNLLANKHLAWQFARREIEAKYKAQRLGILWAILTPLLLLSVYTFVFAIVFPNKWNRSGTAQEPLGAFALSMFIGLLVFGLFRDLAARGPHQIVNHANYVKKVVFPLEVLALSELLSALVTFAIGATVWLIGWVAIQQRPPEATILLTPLFLIPVCLASLGISWFLASLGVFLRDIANVVELAIAVLFFVSPIFYSMKYVAEPIRSFLIFNPMAPVIEGIRSLAIEGSIPDLTWYFASLAVSLVLALAGYAFFMKSKRAFADVI